MSQIINQETLSEATDCKTNAELEKTLRAQKIRFFYGKNGRIWTTVQALNAALGLYKQDDHSNIDFL